MDNSEKKKRGRPQKKIKIDEDVQENQIKVVDPLKKKAGEFKIKKKLKLQEEDENEQNQDKNNQFDNFQENSKNVRLDLDKLNIYKIFQDILSQSAQDENFIIIKNIIYNGYKSLNDKKQYLRKLKHQLTLSNLAQHEYKKKEQDIESMEKNEKINIQEDILHKLSASRIAGFENRDTIMENLRIKHIKSAKFDENQIEELDFQIVVDENEFEQLKQDQLKLINMLLNEPSLNTCDEAELKNMKEKNLYYQQQSMNDKQIHEKIDNHDKEQQERDYNNKPRTLKLMKYFEEGEINQNLHINLYQRLFDNLCAGVKVDNQEDIFQMTRNEKDILLHLKSDLMYNDSDFQKQQYKEYSQYLKDLYENGKTSKSDIDEKVFNDLVTITTFVLNNAHYYQKYRLDEDLLNPLDVLFILDQFK